jgi:hypothetical protein
MQPRTTRPCLGHRSAPRRAARTPAARHTDGGEETNKQINQPNGVTPSVTLHSMFGQSQNFQILIKYIGKTINNYETKYMQYENIFYGNSNDGYFVL